MAPATIPDAPHTAAMASPSDMKVGAPAVARTSFTMSEAKAHIEKAGYTGVADLVKTNDGVWQGKAMSHGQPVGVSVDSQGRVATR